MKLSLKKATSFLVLICIISISFSAQGQQRIKRNNGIKNGAKAGTWRDLGTVHAKHSGDQDALQVTGPHDYYRKIKLKVTDAPVNIHKLVVRYDDGAPENIDIRQEIPKNGESRIIDLRGGRRKLKSIEFWYDTKGILNGTSDVTVFGMK